MRENPAYHYGMTETAPRFLNPKLTPVRVWTARAIAVAADAIQIAGAALFAEGAASPFNDALDVAVAVVMIALLGFNWAFLPSLVAEMIPFVDLAPTWTLAVLFVTRKGSSNVPHDRDKLHAKPVASRVVE